MKSNLLKIFVSFFYIGNIKYAPGSFTSFLVLFFWFFIPNNPLIQFGIISSITVSGFITVNLYLKNVLDKDPQYIVIDEVVGMMIGLYMIPKEIYLYIIGFVCFRFFDILKPSIIYRSQRFNNGVGVMIDDILSGVLTFIIVYNIYL